MTIPFDKVCRVCMAKSITLMPIWNTDAIGPSTNRNDAQKASLNSLKAIMLSEFTHFGVSIDDPLPKNICLDCENDLDQAFLFKQKCERSEIGFRNYLKLPNTEISQLQINCKQEYGQETERSDGFDPLKIGQEDGVISGEDEMVQHAFNEHLNSSSPDDAFNTYDLCTTEFTQEESFEQQSNDNSVNMESSDSTAKGSLAVPNKYSAARKRKKGNEVVKPEKSFVAQYECDCRQRCHEKVPVQVQRRIFKAFVTSNWLSKSIFIANHILSKPVASRRSVQTDYKKRDCCRDYFLEDATGVSAKVCKKFFMSCIQTHSSKIERVLLKQKLNRMPTDLRGRKEPPNKTKQSDIAFILSFVDQFPTYESNHRPQKSTKKYLPPSLNFRKFYNEYKRKCLALNQKVVSLSVFRKIFKAKFKNLCFKRQKTDTCKTCDQLDKKQKSKDSSENELEAITLEKVEHVRLAQKIKTAFNEDIELAKRSNNEIYVLVFGLQRPLETPFVTDSDCYYKRLLWTFDLCIHDEVRKQAYMYVWCENIGSRGSDEIASCLIKHFKTAIPPSAKKIILYSDGSCVQKQNIEFNLLLKKFLIESASVVEIEQKYFLAGHTFNSCDRNFALVEKEKKHLAIYTPNMWMDLIRNTKKSAPKFVPVKMESCDFFSSKALGDMIVNREITSQKEKVNWLNIHSVTNKRVDLLRNFIATFAGDEFIINLQKNQATMVDFKNAPWVLSNKNGRPITEEKHKDLMQLMRNIPEDHHYFYETVFSNVGCVDYGLATNTDNEQSDADD